MGFVLVIKERTNLGRSLDMHINEKELNALVPSRCEAGSEVESAASECVTVAERHVASCPECRSKVQEYSFLVNHLPIALAKVVPRGIECPEEVDWNEVSAGHWPEWKAKQLMMHAALCDHCGPLLRAAARMQYDPSHQEEVPVTASNASPRPDPRSSRWHLPLWQSIKWLAPAAALILIVGFMSIRPRSSRTSLSGEQFAELAVKTHRQHVQGNLVLDIRSKSQQRLNEWLKAKSPFVLALPESPAVPGEERPYDPEGARLVQIGSNKAAFIAYRMEASLLRRTNATPAAASLMVIPASAATASGGLEVRFTKVSFHYATVEGYKVVTWSVHGLTYALVSGEGNNTQRSCMVCHSAMRDRDLSHTPTPLLGQEGSAAPVWH
jgi:hypothetical protein